MRFYSVVSSFYATPFICHTFQFFDPSTCKKMETSALRLYVTTALAVWMRNGSEVRLMIIFTDFVYDHLHLFTQTLYQQSWMGSYSQRLEFTRVRLTRCINTWLSRMPLSCELGISSGRFAVNLVLPWLEKNYTGCRNDGFSVWEFFSPFVADLNATRLDRKGITCSRLRSAEYQLRDLRRNQS